MDAYTGDAFEAVHLYVIAQDNTVVKFKIKKHMSLNRLMTVYCERIGLDVATVSFTFNEQFISETDTPSSLEMKEDDTIYILQPQLDDSEKINVKVLSQNNKVIQYKIESEMPLKKLMSAYSDRIGLPMSALKFSFNGQPFTEDDTASSLEMDEGDTIEAYHRYNIIEN